MVLLVQSIRVLNSERNDVVDDEAPRVDFLGSTSFFSSIVGGLRIASPSSPVRRHRDSGGDLLRPWEKIRRTRQGSANAVVAHWHGRRGKRQFSIRGLAVR